MSDSGDGSAVAFGGQGTVAEVVVGQAEAVPGGGLPSAVADLLKENERLLALDDRPAVLAVEGVEPANHVQGKCLSPAVPGGLVEGDGVFRVVYACQNGHALVPRTRPVGSPRARRDLTYCGGRGAGGVGVARRSSGGELGDPAGCVGLPLGWRPSAGSWRPAPAAPTQSPVDQRCLSSRPVQAWVW